jgi:N-acetylneuraminate synthase/sialic acid synthase
VVIGYSSHYSGVSDAVVAYTLGARIIEKHFTLDRTSRGTDHAFSLEPTGFTKMVSYLHKAQAMLGLHAKVVLPEEQGMIDKMRKTTRWYAEAKNAVH